MRVFGRDFTGLLCLDVVIKEPLLQELLVMWEMTGMRDFFWGRCRYPAGVLLSRGKAL